MIVELYINVQNVVILKMNKKNYVVSVKQKCLKMKEVKMMTDEEYKNHINNAMADLRSCIEIREKRPSWLSINIALEVMDSYLRMFDKTREMKERRKEQEEE